MTGRQVAALSDTARAVAQRAGRPGVAGVAGVAGEPGPPGCAGVAGVAGVAVSLEAGEARVSYDPATVSANALRAVIEEVGFDAA